MANELTPMMQQYLDFKNQYRDELLFYRSGDFYEMFFEDAKTASRELGLTLTGRNGGLEERIPMCGVPYHSVEPLRKMVRDYLDTQKGLTYRAGGEHEGGGGCTVVIFD